jgi:hypothetical protein
MSCDVSFSCYTSPSNGASYQMIKPWAQLCYVFEVASAQFKTDGSGPQRILSNTLKRVDIDRCRSHSKSRHEVFDRPRRGCINVRLQVSPHKTSIRVRPGDRGSYVVGPRRPVHPPRYVAVNYCRVSSS